MRFPSVCYRELEPGILPQHGEREYQWTLPENAKRTSQDLPIPHSQFCFSNWGFPSKLLLFPHHSPLSKPCGNLCSTHCPCYQWPRAKSASRSCTLSHGRYLLCSPLKSAVLLLFVWVFSIKISRRTREGPAIGIFLGPAFWGGRTCKPFPVHAGAASKSGMLRTALRVRSAAALLRQTRQRWHPAQHLLQQLQGSVVQGQPGVPCQVQLLQFGGQVFW